MLPSKWIWRFQPIALTLLVLGGCSSSSNKPSASSSAVSVSTAPADSSFLVKRVEYENWNQFPVGTAVTRTRDITTGDHQVQQSTVYRLISKDDNRVVVESTVTVTRNGQVQVNEPTQLEYAATFRLPANMQAEQFSLPSPNAQSSGSEKIEVLGQTYEATIYKWQSSAEAGPVENTLWMSNEVPGRTLKHQSSCAGTTTEETITQLLWSAEAQTQLSGAE